MRLHYSGVAVALGAILSVLSPANGRPNPPSSAVMSVDYNALLADNDCRIKLTVHVYDSQGNPMTGVAVSFLAGTTHPTCQPQFSPSSTTTSAGIASSLVYTAGVASTFPVYAQATAYGVTVSTLQHTVKFVSGSWVLTRDIGQISASGTWYGTGSNGMIFGAASTGGNIVVTLPYTLPFAFPAIEAFDGPANYTSGFTTDTYMRMTAAGTSTTTAEYANYWCTYTAPFTLTWDGDADWWSNPYPSPDHGDSVYAITEFTNMTETIPAGATGAQTLVATAVGGHYVGAYPPSNPAYYDASSASWVTLYNEGPGTVNLGPSYFTSGLIPLDGASSVSSAFYAEMLLNGTSTITSPAVTFGEMQSSGNTAITDIGHWHVHVNR